MFKRTDDLRITEVRPLIPPAILLEELPITERISNIVSDARQAITNALLGRDPRLVIIAGPCSIHDTRAALDYAEKLAALAKRYKDHLIIVMRSYFEKPRTSVGWKGLGSPAGSNGYKYKGAGTPGDPCKIVILKEKVIKGVCKGSGVTLTPPFAGDVGIVLTVGTTERYCARFGGDEVRDDATLTKLKNAPAPGACP